MSNNKIQGSLSQNSKRVTESKDKNSNKKEKIASGLFPTKFGGVKFSFKPLKAFKAWINSFGKNKINTRVEKRFESLKKHLNIDVKDLTQNNGDLKKIYNKIRFGRSLSGEDIEKIEKLHNSKQVLLNGEIRDAIIDKLKTADDLAFRINYETKATDDVEVLLMNEVMDFLGKNENYLKDCTTNGKLDKQKFDSNITKIFESIGEIVAKENDKALGEKQFESLAVNEIKVTTKTEEKPQALPKKEVESTIIKEEKKLEPELSPLEKAKANLIHSLMDETKGIFSEHEINIAIEEVSENNKSEKLPGEKEVLKNLEELAINKYQNAKGDDLAKIIQEKIEAAKQDKKKKLISQALLKNPKQMNGEQLVKEMNRLEKAIPEQKLTETEELKIRNQELSRFIGELRGPLFFRFEVVKQAIDEKNKLNN